MDQKWSLEALYKSFECSEFLEDMKSFENKVQSIKEWADKKLKADSNAKEVIEEYINMNNEFGHLFSRLMNYAELTFSVDAKNEKALQIIEKLESKLPELTLPQVSFQKWLKEIKNLDEVISSSDLIKEHSFYIGEINEKNKYLLSDNEEVLIAKMKNTGSKSWSKLQEMTISNHLVDIEVDGEKKELPLPVVRNMAYENDAKVRKNAYEAELKSYKKIDQTLASCLNGIKGEVITLSKMRGYKSVLDMTVLDSRMDMQILEAMIEAMKESLPSFHKYYKKKAELLGHKNGLPFYEMFAPMGEVNMTYTFEQAREYIVKNFRTFSDKLADFANKAFLNNWIDALPREGKRGGAFCSNLHVIGESRIMSNFTGSFSDVITLAHELGHGYHGDCLNKESYLNSDYPMPIAETASIFCESIVKNAALKEADSEQAFSILESSISDAGQVIVDIYSRFLFESKMVEKRQESSLSVNELKEIMLQAQKDAYGDGLDHSLLHPYMWACKPHYYYGDYNFYNFPYAFGLLFANGLYAEYLKKGDAFVAEYDTLLSATGKNNLFDVAMTMNIDIRKKEFWKQSLSIVEEQIEKFINLK